MEHSLHVASVGVTVARALGLNENLVRAIGVGHDLGHAPFGHTGERALNKLANNHGLAFKHELHSLRIVDFLESPYPEHRGLNLTFAVRDGIACHYGEGFEKNLVPQWTKSFGDLKKIVRGESRPATLEGCVVRWADKVAYLGRDLEDAVALGMIRREDIPPTIREKLGPTNKHIIGTLVRELVQESGGGRDAGISVGDAVHEALNDLYGFNVDRIYRSEMATRHNDVMTRAMESLFDFLLTRLEKGEADPSRPRSPHGRTLQVFAEFLRDDVRDWRTESKPQLVIDFIAGMTDRFFIESFSEIFLPKASV